jgi:subtilisin family serine protease
MYRNLYIYLSLLVIASCGGGGGGGSTPEPSVPSASITLSISDDQIYIGNTVTLTWTTSNASTCTASGSWSGSKALSGSETLTPDSEGQKNYTLTCSNSAGTSTSRTVSTNVIGNSQGVVVGANYISLPTVFLDINSNYQSDDGEPSTSADSTGVFELPNDPQDIISFGGSDNLSGVELTNLSLSYKASSSSSRVVSALTSLDYANTGSTDINTLLDLDSSIDIYSDNPVAGIDSSSAANKYYEANAQIFVLAYALQAFVNETNASSNNSKTFFESLYTTIQQNFDSGVTNLSEHIETSSFIDTYIDNVLSANNISLSSSSSDEISSTLSTDLKSILKSIVEKISVRNDTSATSAIINYATGTFLNDVIALANGTADPERIATYTSNLNSLIASDQNIDESSLDQALTLADDSVSTDEDNSLEFSPLDNDVIDAGTDYYGLSLSITAPSNGTASLDLTNNITYSPNENYFGSDSFTYTVNVDGTSVSANIDVDVISVNDPPTFKDFVSSSSIDENTLNVLSVTVEDIENDVIGYSLSGNDAEKLSISTSGAITFKTNPDFETPADANSDNSYEITVEASDGTDTVSDDLVITILNVENEGNPIIEGLSSQSVDENESIGISFTVTDPQNDTITYSLSGVDKDLFTLTFDGLNASLTSSIKDYELPEDSDSNNVYLVSVNFSDELNTTSQEVEVSIGNVNDNDPVITSSGSFTVSENQQAVATLTATDADNDDLTFSIIGGDSTDFEITDSGILTLKSNANFEVKNSYSFTASVTDGLYSSSSLITVNISDVNEPPVWNNNIQTVFEYPENSTAVEIIDIPEDIADEDGDALSYSLSGTDGSLFLISGNAVSFEDAPDYENPSDSNGDNIYNLNVIATDGELSATSPEFTVTITNINDNAPTFVDLSTNIEVTNGQSNVVDISTTDADGDDVTLSKSGTDSSLFSISDSGNLSFTSAPDFANPVDNNGDNVYKLNISASDGSFTTTSDEISITVLEVNNPPVISDLQTSYTLDENIAEIATFSVTDPESNQLTIGVSGDDSAGFSVVSNLLYFEGGLNYESPSDSDADNVYTITVFADDGFNRTTQDVQITVLDVSESPEFVGLDSQVFVEENVRIVTPISVVDPEGSGVSWGISGGADEALFRTFNVDAANGSIAFIDFDGADYEEPNDANSDGVYELQVRAVEDTAEALETILDLLITVTDIKDTYTVNGTLYSNRYAVIDGDVQNTLAYTYTENNSAESAQTILNPTDVVGHIGDNVVDIVLVEDGFCIGVDENGDCLTQTLENFDTEDWFKFTSAPNLAITLQNEGLIYEDLPDNPGSFYCCETDSMDIDLLLYNEDGTLADFTYTSNSTATRQTIALPNSGIFYAVVKANEGHAKYVLTFGSNVTGASSFSSPKDNFAKNRFISYQPFGPDYEYNQADAVKIDIYPDDSVKAKFNEINDRGFVGLRRFNFSIDNEYKKLFGSSYLDLETFNPDQAEYIKHWKVLQYYRNLYPRLNLEFDTKASAMNFTKDPAWNYQWNLQQIGLETALTAIGQETKDVAVAVLDSGSPSTDSTAYTTAAFLPGGYDFVPFGNSSDGDDYDPDPTDATAASDSHGTHVGTTIAALNDGNNINGFGIGVVPVRVLGGDGTGFVSDIIQGLLYAGGLPNASGVTYSETIPIKVINMSLGSTGSSCAGGYQGAINDLYERNISIVSSSGNSGTEVYGSPSSCNNVISVAATEATGNRAYYSTFNDLVDIAAPGGDLGADANADGYSDGVLAFGSNEDLAFFQGTSMASPHVAGAIGILYALVPELLSTQVDALIIDGHLTDDIGEEGRDNEFGYGLLNINKAVTRIIDEEGLDFTYGSISPGSINLGKQLDAYDIDVTKVGDGELSVSSVENDIPSAITISEIDVDDNGFGKYRLNLDRSLLPDGLYSTRTKVTFSNENVQTSTATLQIGDDRERPYVQYVSTYLWQIDEGAGVRTLYFGDDGEMTDGTITFNAPDIPDGQYQYWFFSKLDNFIIDVGELVAIYPGSGSSETYINLDGEDVDINVTLEVRKSGAALGSNNSDKKRYRVYKFNPPMREDLVTN